MAFFLVLLAAVLLVLSAQAVHVAGQPGFLSIDCGLDDEYSGYKDPDSGIVYVSDGTYADAGENLKVAPEYERQLRRRYQTVRSFPSGVRNCYALPTVAGAKYLARLGASYGNHDGRNDSSAMEFDVHLGANYWDTVRVKDDQAYEVLFVAWAGWAPVCLLNTGHGAPFLSVLELRRLGDALYPALMANQTMSMFRRKNMGGEFTRFPDDPYDRLWWPTVDPQWRNISTPQNMQPDPSSVEPVAVLQTAATTTGLFGALMIFDVLGFCFLRYYLTGRLNESSDVYSFGIVLLEAAIGEPPLLPGLGHIVQRVKQRIAAGDIGSIADSRLGGAYDVSSMWKVVDIGMACTVDATAARPTMADIVAQLKDSLALEDARVKDCSIPARTVQRDGTPLMPSFGPSVR